MTEQSWVDRVLDRPVPIWQSVLVISGFVFIAFWGGTTDWFSDDFRSGAAFPIFVGGMILSLKDVLRVRPVPRGPLAAALLALLGSVLVGFQSTADAMRHDGLAFLIITSTVLGIGVIVPLVAGGWIKRRVALQRVVEAEVLGDEDANSEEQDRESR